MGPEQRIIVGDVLAGLRDLEDESVQCVVTSPPYWGLRDYGTATWEGGDPDCPHVFPREDNRLMLGSTGKLGKNCTSWTHRHAMPPRTCKCGARRVDAQLGLEPTPEEHAARMVEVFREVRRVMRTDGTLWFNYGDCYAGSPPRVYLGMPWRVAFALQADGWWLRSDIVWSKPNPMPEPVTARPTRAHEYVFLLTKAARYYYDADAVRESHDPASLKVDRPMTTGAMKRAALGEMARTTPVGRTCGVHPDGRNLRDVWTIPTQPFPGAHFATFPEALVRPCILAGSREGDLVLDPFCGSGTVGVVARKNGRAFVGIELNPKYAAMARKRIGRAYWQRNLF